MPPSDWNFNKRPCPSCGGASKVSMVQNDWSRSLPVRFRGKGWIRRKVTCLDCSSNYWTVEIPQTDLEQYQPASIIEEEL